MPSTAFDRRIMNTRKITVLAALAVAATTFGVDRVEAAGAQLSGVAVYDSSGTCPAAPPDGYEEYVSEYPPIAFTGSLEGCLYIHVDSSRNNGAPSGVYLERGREV